MQLLCVLIVFYGYKNHHRILCIRMKKLGHPFENSLIFLHSGKVYFFQTYRVFLLRLTPPPTPISFSRSNSSRRTAASLGPSVKGGTRVNELRWEVKIAFNCSSVPFTPSLHLSLLWLCFIKRARRTDTLGQASEQFTC